MGRDEDIEAILEVGRRTRKPSPRWLWIAAVLVGVICAAGFAVTMLAPHAAPAHGPSDPERRSPDPTAPAGLTNDDRPGPRAGLGIALGIAAGLAIGLAIARQRRAHSSRNSP